MAQLVRAPPCHGGGRGFESHPGRLHRRPKILCDFFLKYHKLTGILAQLGEHLPYKQRVTGSSPVGPIILKGINNVCRCGSIHDNWGVKRVNCRQSRLIANQLNIVNTPMWLNS